MFSTVQKIVLSVGVVAGGIVGFLVASSAYDAFDNESQLANLSTRCEVHFSAEKCVARPGVFKFGSGNLLLDTHDNADKDEARCLKRAAEYFGYCKSTKPIISFFYRGNTVIASRIAK